MLAFLLYLLRLRRYKAKGVKPSCYQEGVGQFERRFQGEGVVPGEYVLVFTKLDTFCYECATCSRFDTIPACDGRTDGIAIASTALAKRRNVKTVAYHL